jgi:hypothetical protein
MAWNPLTHPINYVLLAGKRSPGIAVVGATKPATAPSKWDERQGYGLSGAWLFYTGDGLAHFNVQLKLYTTQDWDDWHVWKKLVMKRPLTPGSASDVGKVAIKIAGGAIFPRPKALDIWHPLLDELGIRSVVVEDRIQPQLTDETGEWTVEILFAQFRQPKPAFAKPEASKAQEVDPLDAKILANAETMKSLSQELAK